MLLRILRPDHLRLRGARGMSLRVVAGTVWITEDGWAKDSFVAAGTDYRVRGDGMVLVSPEGGPGGAAEIALVPAA